jgi:hypothetical protein
MTPANPDELFRRAKDPRRFPLLCKITSEEGETGYLKLTHLQKLVLDVYATYLWSYVIKPRQAKTSTITGFDLLRHVMLNKGQRGLVIAEKEQTALEIFHRILIAHRNLPPDFHRHIPVKRSTASAIEWAEGHDSFASVVTGGSDNPAIGHSPDYAHITEYGELRNYDTFNPAVFPSISKRPNSRLRIETTPGQYGTPAHRMWLNALNGEGYFTAPRGKALFLEWWTDPSYCQPPEPGFVRTLEEHRLAEKLVGITDGHLKFRRLELDTAYHGDVRLFDSKYPPGPRDGWILHGTPAIPIDAVEYLQSLPGVTSVPEGEERIYEGPEEGIWQDRRVGAPYILTADPAGFGDNGDPSALIVWNGWDWREVAHWSGREDPNLFADRIMRLQRLYDCDVLVEANKGECCAALRSRGCPRLVWDNGQPGWFSTDVKKAQTVTDFVDMLRRRELIIRSQQILDQIAGWDGKTRKRTGGHHWDRAVAAAMIGFAARRMAYGSRPRRASAGVLDASGRPSWRSLKSVFDRRGAEGGMPPGVPGRTRSGSCG